MARSTNIHRNILIDASTDIHRNALVDGSMYSLSLPLQLRYLEGWQAVQGGGVDVRQGVVGWALVWLLVVGWWLAHRYCGQLSLRCMCPLPPFPPPSRCCRLNLKWGRRWGGGGGGAGGGCWSAGNKPLFHSQAVLLCKGKFSQTIVVDVGWMPCLHVC